MRLPVSIGIFAVSLAIYIMTLTPGLTFTDSGELAGVCVTLGIAHPTGYPLFSIIGHFWSLLPLPMTKIYQLNLFAAVCTAASAAALFNAVLTLLSGLPGLAARAARMKSGTRNQIQAKKKAGREAAKTSEPLPAPVESPKGADHIVSAGVALAYAFGATIWQQATAIEVYSLQLLIITATLWTALSAWFSGDRKKFMLAGFMTGLGMANHMTTILMIPALIFLFFRGRDEKFDFSPGRLKLFGMAALCGVAALSLYLYMPIRSAMTPDFNWGAVHRGCEKFLYHVSGRQYQVWMFTGSKAWAENFRIFMSVLPYNFAFIGLVPAVYGVARAFRSSRALAWALVILFASCVIYSFNYSIHDIDSYFVTAFIALMFFMAIGCRALFEKRQAAAWSIFALPIISIALNYSENDRSSDCLVEEYTRITAENLRPGALVISSQWDYFVSAFWYKQRVEGFRRDVVLVEKELLRRTWYPLQFRAWYPEVAAASKNEFSAFESALEPFEAGEPYDGAFIQANYENLLNSFIDKNYGKRPIYLTLDVVLSEMGVGAGYQKVPDGFAFRLEKSQEPFPVRTDNINTDKFERALRGRKEHLETGIAEAASSSFLNIGKYAKMTGRNEEARKAFLRALRINPESRSSREGLEMPGR